MSRHKAKATRKGADKSERARARCVASVARLLNRAAQAYQAGGATVPCTLVQHMASLLVYGDSTGLNDWPAASARALAIAYALHAPDDHLSRLTAQADREYAWCEWWDAPGGGRYQSDTVSAEQDKQLVARTNKLLAMRPAPAGLAVAS